MAACHRCGQTIRWVEVEDERLALDGLPQLRPPGNPDIALYRLVGENIEQAELLGGRSDAHGYTAHRDTCPAVVRTARR